MIQAVEQSTFSRLSLLFKILLMTALGICVLPSRAQNAEDKTPLLELLRQNSHELALKDGRLGGDGLDVLLKAAEEAQFVCIAEEHNRLQIPEITTALFSHLQSALGFHYLALEQAAVAAEMMASPPLRGDLKALSAFARKYTNAPTFITDQELRMISDVGRLSEAEVQPVWGLDQEFGVLHILDRIEAQAPDDASRLYLDVLREKARPFEEDRFASEKLFMAEVAEPGDFLRLHDLFRPEPGSPTDSLIRSLLVSSRIYSLNVRARLGEATGYRANLEREKHMKSRFLSGYRAAQKSGEEIPKVLLKLGHWHVYRGLYRGNVYTLGNFLSEFAVSNGKSAFMLSTALLGDPDDFRNTKGVLAEAAAPDRWTLFDFRPLRASAHAGKISGISDSFKMLLFRVDAILVIRGSLSGTYVLTRDWKGESPGSMAR